VSYGFVHAGTSEFNIPEIVYVEGRKCFRVTWDARSAAFFSWFYKVEDHYETFVDAEGIFPWYFEQHTREGSYHKDFAAYFDQVNHVARTTDGNYPIPEYCHDVVSALYYVRVVGDFKDARPGERIHMKNFYKDSVYVLDVKYLGRQQMEVDAGTFDCIIIEPLLREGGLFKADGRIIIWVTDDEKKIPIKVKTEVVIGSIDAELKEYSGINGPIQAKRD
jgi:hypothetical protein